MKIIKISILLFVFAAFASCDGVQHVRGVVIDADTRLPIDNVMVNQTSKSTTWAEYTDSLGYFDYFAVIPGFPIPKISLSFEKEGYIKVTKKYDSCPNAVVVLQKQMNKKNNTK